MANRGVVTMAGISLLALAGCGGGNKSGAVAVDGGGGDAGAAGDGASADGGASPFPAVTDFAATGPFPTTSAAEGPSCTIFRPATLGEGGRRHPIIVWGNGTGASPKVYAAVLTHWASHGFIVAAANSSNSGSGQEMLACLGYVIGEDATVGSAYAGSVNTRRVGVSGHSQGGGGTTMAGRDPRVTATAPLEPYILGTEHDDTSHSHQTGPMFLMSGSLDTVAVPAQNQQLVFDFANEPIFWGTLSGADHVQSAIGNISGFRGPTTAWFRLHLMGDESARSVFYGAACGLCTDSTWAVQRKGID